MDSGELERQAIEAAMKRLLAGAPARSNGSLTILTLAEEAGLKRNKLTHKHTDLRDRFRAEVARREGVSHREAVLRDQIALLTAQLAEAKTDRDQYRAAGEVFARAIHVLTVENENRSEERRV